MIAPRFIVNGDVVVNDVIWCFWKCDLQMSHQCHTKFKGLKALKYVTSLTLREIAGCSAVGSAQKGEIS